MAKIIIDISDEDYTKILTYYPGCRVRLDAYALMRIMQSGIIIPNNATNGDIIKIMFPEILVEEYSRRDMCIDFDGRSHLINKNWWNSLYEENEEST